MSPIFCPGYRDGDTQGQTEAHLRSVCPGGWLYDTAIWGNRAWFGNLHETCGPDARKNLGGEHSGGKGACFISQRFFPSRKAATSSQPVQQVVTAAKPASRGLRILIAEDNPVNQAVAVGTLQNEGHTLSLAENGREAVRLYHFARPDLILMDVQMPELDGIGAAREIRAVEESSGHRTPIIAMTAYAMKGDSERCLLAGMDAYLSKPLTKELLLKAIESIVKDDHAATAPATTSPPFSRAVLLDNLDGDTELLDRVTTLFKENAPAYLAQMRQAIVQRDGLALQKSAHTLVALWRFRRPSGQRHCQDAGGHWSIGEL